MSEQQRKERRWKQLLSGVIGLPVGAILLSLFSQEGIEPLIEAVERIGLTATVIIFGAFMIYRFQSFWELQERANQENDRRMAETLKQMADEQKHHNDLTRDILEASKQTANAHVRAIAGVLESQAEHERQAEQRAESAKDELHQRFDDQGIVLGQIAGDVHLSRRNTEALIGVVDGIARGVEIVQSHLNGMLFIENMKQRTTEEAAPNDDDANAA